MSNIHVFACTTHCFHVWYINHTLLSITSKNTSSIIYVKTMPFNRPSQTTKGLAILILHAGTPGEVRDKLCWEGLVRHNSAIRVMVVPYLVCMMWELFRVRVWDGRSIGIIDSACAINSHRVTLCYVYGYQQERLLECAVNTSEYFTS